MGDLACLDVEKGDDGATWAQRLSYVLEWVALVAAETGARPLVYANWTWIKGLRDAASIEQWATLTAGTALWLAEWTMEGGKHSTVTSKDGADPDSWPVLLHQYGVVSGIDRNWTPDLQALRACGATRA